jgi:hypothetical protein
MGALWAGAKQLAMAVDANPRVKWVFLMESEISGTQRAAGNARVPTGGVSDGVSSARAATDHQRLAADK